MTLLKHIKKPTLLIPYEQLFVQLYHYNSQLILEQHSGEYIPMFQLIFNLHNTAHTPPDRMDRYLNFNTTQPVPFQPGLPTVSKDGMFILHFIHDLIAFFRNIYIGYKFLNLMTKFYTF
jgi:hypothetical protein